MQDFRLALLLEDAQLHRAAYHYQLKKMAAVEKYEAEKAEISIIYHENEGRYGYRRITAELYNRNINLNYKTVQRLMKVRDLTCCIRTKKYHSDKGNSWRKSTRRTQEKTVSVA